MSEHGDGADAGAVRDDWHGRGFSFGIWRDPPGQIWADFVHDSDELVMLADGAIELSFCGQVLRPQRGEEVLIPAGEPHTVRNIGTAANCWYYGYRTRV